MVSNQDIKHMKWCAENQMEKLWDLRGHVSAALTELLELRQREEWVHELIAASKEAVCKLGECTTTLSICEAIFKLQAPPKEGNL